MGVLVYGLLVITGRFAMVMAGGLAVVHWGTGRRPYLDVDGWHILAYGATATAVTGVLDGGPGWWTITTVAVAVHAARMAGLRSCGPLIAVLTDPDRENDT